MRKQTTTEKTDKHVITVKGIDFYLSKLTFDVYSKATMSLMGSGSGKVNLMEAGSIIFDSCYIPDLCSLHEIKEDVKLYASICLSCAELLDFEDVKLKKN